MKGRVELVVIGAGPAGIEAAVTAAQAGVEVVLIDSSPMAGGQYFIQMPGTFECDDRSAHEVMARDLCQRLASSGVTVLWNTLVWGVFEGTRPGEWCLTLYGPGAPFRLEAQALVLAGGAYDRSVAFPGWDLPGVITTGARALRLVKQQRILPGKRVILSGTGPLQLSAAAHLVWGGAQVVEVLECGGNFIGRGIPYLPAVWGQWARMAEGLQYMKTLVGAGVPYRTGRAVIAAEGGERVSRAITARLDRSGRPLPGSEHTLEVDTVVVGYNVIPATELCRVIDCEMAFEPLSGVFIPRRSDEMETSRLGVFAVGDGAGIGGAEMAMIEGRIAGRAAARRLGHAETNAARSASSADQKALRREQRFARLLADIFTPPPGLYALAKEDTVICRCEQVTLGQVRQAIGYGAQTVSDVKSIMRTGMGNCQGRTCAGIVARILAAEAGCSLEEANYLNIRPPLHPVPLGVVEEYTAQPGESSGEGA